MVQKSGEKTTCYICIYNLYIKSYETQDVLNISTGAGFGPSTVCILEVRSGKSTYSHMHHIVFPPPSNSYHRNDYIFGRGYL